MGTVTATPKASKCFYAYLYDTHGMLAKVHNEILFMADDGTLTVIEPEHCAFLMPLGELGLADGQMVMDRMRGSAAKIACTRGGTWEHHLLRAGCQVTA